MTRKEYYRRNPVPEREHDEAPRWFPWQTRLLYPNCRRWPQSSRAVRFRSFRLMSLDRLSTLSIRPTPDAWEVIKRAWREHLAHLRATRRACPIPGASLGVKTGVR